MPAAPTSRRSRRVSGRRTRSDAKPLAVASKPDLPWAITQQAERRDHAATTWVTTYVGTSLQSKRRPMREADGDRGVEVPARDVTHGVGHRQDGEAEREGDAVEADVDAGEDGGATAAEHEQEGAEELGGDTLGERVHGVSPFSQLLPGVIVAENAATDGEVPGPTRVRVEPCPRRSW